MKKKRFSFLASRRGCLWTQSRTQKSITRSTACAASVHLTGVTQSEYLRRQSTSYFLSMCAILLWNDFCTSVTYKNNHTLDIFILFLFFFFVTTIVSFLFCYIPACLTTYRPSGLNINDRTCQIRLNIHNTFNAAALILLCLLFLIEFRRGTEEAKAVMKCEHLCRQVLHVCAALKVSGSYFHCAISGWS